MLAVLCLWGICVLTTWGCQNNHSQNIPVNKTGTSITSAKDSLAYTLKEYKLNSQYFAERNGQIDTTFVHVSYPEFQDSNLNELIKNSMLLEGENSIEQFANNFIEAYSNFIEENTIQYNTAWTKTTDVRVLLNTPEIITVKNTTYEFSGGAHGNMYELINVYSLDKYQKLALNNFISVNKMKEFTKIVEEFFRKQEGLSDTASLNKDYFFENGKFALSANYGIVKEGILFHYNQYEIKPYAFGTTTIIIPFSAVLNCMTETGKNQIEKIKKFYHTTL